MRVLTQRWKLALLGIGVLVLVLLVLGSMRGADGVGHARSAAALAASLEPRLTDLKNGDLSAAASLRGRLAEIESGLGSARSELTPFIQVTPLVGWVPSVGSKLRNAGDMLDLGTDLVAAARDLLSAADLATPGNVATQAVLQADQFSTPALRAFAQGNGFYSSALARLQRVRQSLGSLKTRALPSEYKGLVAVAERVAPDLERFARAGLAVSQSWERFLGYGGARTYLVVAQNSDELRATGGFIPGVWVLTLDNGQIARLEFTDTTAVDNLKVQYPLPPEGLLQSIWAGAWLFRDAGWLPDYPSSAQVMERIFRLARDIEIDGVVSLDQWTVKFLLEALGPVTLPGGKQVDAASYLGDLEQGTDALGRAYMDTVLQGLLDRLRRQGSSDDLLRLVTALNRSLQEKHLLLFFKDPQLQAVAASNGWAGSLADAAGDYLMVVSSNVGFSKVNRNVEQQIDYQVNIEAAGTASARLEIGYSNRSHGATGSACAVQGVAQVGPTYQEQKNTCYWNYLRVYVPPGADLRAASPLRMPDGALYRRIGYNDIEETGRAYAESGRKVFAGFMTVDIGETRKVAFSYDLPPGTVERAGDRMVYSLTLQKQPGTLGTPVTVIVTPPQGFRVKDSNIPITKQDGRTVRFSIDLTEDAGLKVVMDRGEQPVPQLVDRSGEAGRVDLSDAVSVTVPVVVLPAAAGPSVTRLDVLPKDITLVPGQQILFTAIALDASGVPVPNAQLQWETTLSQAGAISPNGFFTAGTATGLYPDAVRVTASTRRGTTAARVTVRIVTPAEAGARLLDRVVPVPSSVTVSPRQTIGLGAVSWDQRGRFVQGVHYQWTVLDATAGRVDRIGFFTATANAGDYPNVIRVAAVQDGPNGPITRTATISVRVTELPQRGVLSQLTIIPRAVVVAPGQRLELLARAFDETAQAISGVSLTWDVGQLAAGSFEAPGIFVAAPTPGRYPDAIRVVATQDTPGGKVTIETSVGVAIEGQRPLKQPVLANALLTPNTVTLRPGQKFVFLARGLDANGETAITQARWQVTDPNAGAVDSLGVFTASNKPGVYQDAVRVTLTQTIDGKTVTAETSATVSVHGRLARVEVRPPAVTLEAGGSVRLRAVGFDDNGIEVPVIVVRWRVKNPLAGTIDASGLFVASDRPGEYPDAITVSAAGTAGP